MDIDPDSPPQPLDQLLQRRDRLQQELDWLNREIAARTQRPSFHPPPRPRNERTLRDYVLEILNTHPQGLTLAELAVQVQQAGYRSASANFRNVLYQCVYNTRDVYHDESTGKYRLKSSATRDVSPHAPRPT